jgi:hypothetical protein
MSDMSDMSYINNVSDISNMSFDRQGLISLLSNSIGLVVAYKFNDILSNPSFIYFLYFSLLSLFF